MSIDGDFGIKPPLHASVNICERLANYPYICSVLHSHPVNDSHLTAERNFPTKKSQFGEKKGLKKKKKAGVGVLGGRRWGVSVFCGFGLRVWYWQMKINARLNGYNKEIGPIHQGGKVL